MNIETLLGITIALQLIIFGILIYLSINSKRNQKGFQRLEDNEIKEKAKEEKTNKNFEEIKTLLKENKALLKENKIVKITMVPRQELRKHQQEQLEQPSTVDNSSIVEEK